MAITLKALRVNAGLKQKEAAGLIGITPETLSSWETGKTFPTVDKIGKIEQIYNTTYNDIKFIVEESE